MKTDRLKENEILLNEFEYDIEDAMVLFSQFKVQGFTLAVSYIDDETKEEKVGFAISGDIKKVLKSLTTGLETVLEQYKINDKIVRH